MTRTGPSAVTDEAARHSEPSTRQKPTCTVLIADDDRDLCESLRDVLELEEHVVEMVHTGRDTLIRCSENAYDLVLLDINLPDVSGLELISRLEELQTELDILVITGNASVDSAIHAVSRSTIGYLTKPLDLERLLGILARIAARTALTRENLRLVQEREALIEQLEAKNAELERYTYTVSHDLKSPLITITGFLGLAEKSAKAGDWEQLDGHISRIAQAARTMRDLLDQLLELSRIGRIANPSEDVSLSEIGHQVRDLVAGHSQDDGAEILVHDGMPVRRVDRLRMVEVIQNLVDNSIKFMGDQENPRVEIGCRDEGDDQVFFVKDNGIGIPPRYQQRIFGLFDKGRSGTAGTGVGLAIVKRIIEIHGGRVWIESEGVAGQGAAFCFTLGASPGG